MSTGTGSSLFKSDKEDSGGAAGAASAASATGGSGGGGQSTYYKKLRALLEKLSSNDENFSSIDFCKQKNYFAYCWDDDDLFSHLLGVLRTNTVITKIDLDPTLLRRLPKEQGYVFYEALGCLENLQELNLTSLTGSSSVLDIQLLILTLSRCNKNLKSLRLHSMRPNATLFNSNGDDDDYDNREIAENCLRDLQGALKGCVALEKLEMYVTATTTNVDLDLFVRSFAMLPNLQELRLISSLRKRTAWISGNTIYDFIKMRSLRRVTLRNQRLLSEHMNYLVDALLFPSDEDGDDDNNDTGAAQKQPQLQEEEDATENSAVSGTSTSPSPSKLRSNLEFLDVKGNNLGDYGAMAIAKVLSARNNKNYTQTITELDLRENWIGDQGIIAIAEALQTNKTLQILNCQQNNLSEDGYISLIHMLQRNYFMEELEIDTIDTPDYIIEKMDFYLQLNCDVCRSNLLHYDITKDKNPQCFENDDSKNNTEVNDSESQRDADADIITQKTSEDEEEVVEEMEPEEVEEEVEEEMEDMDDDKYDDNQSEDEESHYQPKEEFYGQVLPTTTKDDWLGVIEDNIEELDCVYYLFRSNPSLCDVVE